MRTRLRVRWEKYTRFCRWWQKTEPPFPESFHFRKLFQTCRFHLLTVFRSIDTNRQGQNTHALNTHYHRDKTKVKRNSALPSVKQQTREWDWRRKMFLANFTARILGSYRTLWDCKTKNTVRLEGLKIESGPHMWRVGSNVIVVKIIQSLVWGGGDIATPGMIPS